MADEYFPLLDAEEGNEVSWYKAGAAGKASGVLKVLKDLNGKIVYDPFSQTYKMMEWKDGKPGVKFEWNSIDEISIPIAPEPVKEVGKYDISEDIFNVGIGQQVPTP